MCVRSTHLHGLVQVAHILRLHIRVLLAGAHQLGEGGQQALDADAWHVHKLPRHQRCSQPARGRGTQAGRRMGKGDGGKERRAVGGAAPDSGWVG